MTVLNVLLSEQASDGVWGENALISYAESAVNVHFSGSFPLRKIQQAGARLRSQGIKEVTLSGELWTAESQWAFYCGFAHTLNSAKVNWCEAEGVDIAQLEARSKAANWVRYATNAAPEDMYPHKLAEDAVAHLTAIAGDKVTSKVVAGDELLEQGWIGIHSVGRASVREPVLLEVDFNPTGDANAPVSACLVGKGITFDSGGYSIKANAGMATMKCDMGGAATVTAALGYAIEQGLNQRVKMFLCCAENLIAGNAYKLGDILTYKNGVTVEILNTDAEGRLVLADGLMAAGETGAPLIIDAATLTGAAMMAVGEDYNALFSLDKELLFKAQAVSEQVNEPGWPLPLAPWHQDKCPSPYAQTANSRPVKGGGAGGASNAAAFLSRFVPNEGKGWLHIDLASAFRDSGNSFWAAGATGLGVANIAQLLLEEQR